MQPQAQTIDPNIDLTGLRKSLCSLLHCQDFCPKREDQQCQQLREAVAKATQLANQILQVLEEWEKATPWPD